VLWPFRASSPPAPEPDTIGPPPEEQPAAEAALKPAADFTSKAPVDVHALAGALGLQLVEAWLPNDLAGKLTRTGEGYVLTIDASHDRLRCRLAIAHGIARFTLQKHLFGGDLAFNWRYRSSLGESMDQEASAFAAMILMPPTLMQRSAPPACMIPELARTFDVPPELAETRLAEHGPRAAQ
jgi:hypothetical protein